MRMVLVPLTLIVTTGLAFAALAGDKAAPKAPAAAPPAAWLTAAKDQKWVPFNPKEPKGIQVAVVSGDMKGPTQMLMKIPAGGKSGVHAHTSDYVAVVISGAHSHGDTDATLKAAGPGSTWFEPGKHMHADSCTGATECVLFLTFTQSGPDFIPPAVAAAAPAPAAPAPAKK